MYENICKLCKNQGDTRKYVGETARSTFRRSAEHMADLRNQKVESHMHHHILECHPDLVGQLRTPEDTSEVFEFKVVKKHSNSMNRQIQEAVRIVRTGGGALNNKEEYNRCSIPTLMSTNPPAQAPLETTPVETTIDLTQCSGEAQKKKRPRNRSQARQPTKNKEQRVTNTPTPSKRQCRGREPSTAKKANPIQTLLGSHQRTTHTPKKRSREEADLGLHQCSPAKKPSREPAGPKERLLREPQDPAPQPTQGTTQPQTEPIPEPSIKVTHREQPEAGGGRKEKEPSSNTKPPAMPPQHQPITAPENSQIEPRTKKQEDTKHKKQTRRNPTRQKQPHTIRGQRSINEFYKSRIKPSTDTGGKGQQGTQREDSNSKILNSFDIEREIREGGRDTVTNSTGDLSHLSNTRNQGGQDEQTDLRCHPKFK